MLDVLERSVDDIMDDDIVAGTKADNKWKLKSFPHQSDFRSGKRCEPTLNEASLVRLLRIISPRGTALAVDGRESRKEDRLTSVKVISRGFFCYEPIWSSNRIHSRGQTFLWSRS